MCAANVGKLAAAEQGAQEKLVVVKLLLGSDKVNPVNSAGNGAPAN